MKVLLINHFPLQGSGSGIYTLNIALELQKKGHEAHVMVMDNEFEQGAYPFPVTTVLFDKTKNQNPDLEYNFPCFTTHPRSVNTFYNLSQVQIEMYIAKMAEKTKEIMQKWKPDIIHAQHLWLAPYVAAQLKMPYVITAHGTDLMGFKKDKRYRTYVEKAVEKAAKIITISRQVHEETKQLLSAPEEKLFLNPNGFDDEIFKVKQVDRVAFNKRLHLPDDYDKLISFVGKFTDFKGIDVLIRAAKIVSEHVDKAIFVLAGDGGLRNKLKAMAEQLNLTNVYFVGHQPQDVIADLYNLADVSVVPSRIEPFGLVAIEALACGTPVVATNAGGLPDFITQEVGALVEMENHEDLAKAITKELTENSKLSKGKKAAQYAIKSYSWEKNIGNVINIYEESVRN